MSQSTDKNVQNTLNANEFQGGGGATPTPGTVAMPIITMATSVPFQPPEVVGKARAVCWTMFNYEDRMTELRTYAAECKYMVWGREICPTTGRRHLQGYTAWRNPQSVSEFAKRFKMHVQKAKGTAGQNRIYCTKCGDFEEFGEQPKQGRRSDWEEVAEQAQNGVSTRDIIHEFPHLLPSIRAIENMRERRLLPLERDVRVYVLYGQSGSGKTRWAWDNYRASGLYAKPTPKQSGTWWNGYDGQKAILIDDFYGDHLYSDLLRLVDRYPYAAPICGGGYVWAQWDTVIFTSNKHPAKWYKQGMTPALRRRLHKILRFTIIDGKTNIEEVSATPEAEDFEAPQDGTTPCTAES